jgi:hypothetical protein
VATKKSAAAVVMTVEAETQSGVVMQHPTEGDCGFAAGDFTAEVKGGRMVVPPDVVEAARQAGFVVVETAV